MKKISGILTIAIVAATLFFGSNFDKKIDSNEVLAMEIAHAQVIVAEPDLDECSSKPDQRCTIQLPVTVNGIPLRRTFSDCEPDKWYTLADCL